MNNEVQYTLCMLFMSHKAHQQQTETGLERMRIKTAEESLIVPDFTISVYSGNSCHSLFYGLILSSFLFLSILAFHPALRDVNT